MTGEKAALQGLLGAIMSVPFIKSKKTPKTETKQCKHCPCFIQRDVYPDTKEVTAWCHDHEDETGECPTCSLGCDNPKPR